MAKYETRIYADFDHFLRYMENSINHGTAQPAHVADYIKGDIHICIRRFDVIAPVRFLTLMGRKGRKELIVEILESGVFYNKGGIDDSGDRFAPYIQEIIDSYKPDTSDDKNSYYRHKYGEKAPRAESEISSPEIPGLFDRIKKIFR